MNSNQNQYHYQPPAPVTYTGPVVGYTPMVKTKPRTPPSIISTSIVADLILLPIIMPAVIAVGVLYLVLR